jgi:glycine cleavage system H protein
MVCPKQLCYTKGHQWLSFEEGYAFIGITDFAQKELGPIVLVEILHLSKTVKQEGFLGIVEADKSVLDLFMPVTGIISEINQNMMKYPRLINKAPYEIWLVKVWVLSIYNPPLLTADEYKTFIGYAK